MVSEDIQRTIGKHLKAWRERSGRSLAEASAKLNLPITVLKGIEAGLIRTPHPLLEALAQTYEATELELRFLIALESDYRPER